jgi:ribosomal-protein-alanine N-acetyltransferase
MSILETKRTILCIFTKDDLSALNALMSDPKVMQYTGFRTIQSQDKIKASLDKWINDRGVFCVEHRTSGEFIGWFMLKETNYKYPELGFMLPQQLWGKGFATEVAKALIDHGFKSLGYTKIIATTVADNSASIAVLKKIGMCESKIEVAKDPTYEILCYEINK